MTRWGLSSWLPSWLPIGCGFGWFNPLQVHKLGVLLLRLVELLRAEVLTKRIGNAAPLGLPSSDVGRIIAKPVRGGLFAVPPSGLEQDSLRLQRKGPKEDGVQGLSPADWIAPSWVDGGGGAGALSIDLAEAFFFMRWA